MKTQFVTFMKIEKVLLIALLAIILGFGKNPPAVAQESNFKSFAETPPMGWNSYNAFGPNVREAGIKENARCFGKKPDVAWLAICGTRFFLVLSASSQKQSGQSASIPFTKRRKLRAMAGNGRIRTAFARCR